MKIKFLSHETYSHIPVYGNGEAIVSIREIKSLRNGDTCNVFSFSMENHWGTHVDLPAHFYQGGKRVMEYPAEDWFFRKPYIVQITLDESQLISPEDIGQVPSGTDILLVKSGFGRYRGQDRYSLDNPGFRPETGTWLRENFPIVRAVGFDFVSLSAYRHRELGRRAHQAFLNPAGPNSPVLIIEDMDLSTDLNGLASVWVAPMRLVELDSVPCTVMGVFIND